jgi:hypothetical protein
MLYEKLAKGSNNRSPMRGSKTLAYIYLTQYYEKPKLNKKLIQEILFTFI